MCRASLWARALLVLCALTAQASLVPGKVKVTKGAVVLRNPSGMEAHILPVGACVQRLLVPDRDGKLADVMAGFDDPEEYRTGSSPTGCIVGRVGGRISGSQFTLDGVTYKLEGKNNYTMHGGGIGYNRVDWTLESNTSMQAVFAYLSWDGQQDFPGNLSIQLTYTLTDDNQLIHDIVAVTDKTTPVGMFSHPYFNLAGMETGETVLSHKLKINASHYMPVDSKNVQMGEIVPVAGTPYDFQATKTIKDSLNDPSIDQAKGYAVSLALFGLGPDAKDVVQDFKGADPPQLALTMIEPKSGRGLHILSTTPAMVLYAPGGFNMKGKEGLQYPKYGAVALEMTMFPDAVNQPNYPSQILRPGGEFRQQIVWRFFNTPASTGSGSQGSCLAKFPGCKQCKGGKCTACTCSSDIPDPKTSKCRAKTCAEANPGCSTCKSKDVNVCTKCQRTHSLVSKTKKCKKK